MIRLGENRYGKSRVRLVGVKRDGEWHELHADGDNSKILPTDTMKNTVYSLARTSSAACIEDFASELTAFFLNRNPQVTSAEVNISECPWDRMVCGGNAHAAAFIQSSRELRTASVSAKRDGTIEVVSGLDNLIVLKTANSAFTGYLKDSLTTLPETRDRLFGTALSANWTYASVNLSFPALRPTIRELLLDAFARHKSESVQHTLYAMAQRVLENVREVKDIHLTMPNKHCLLVDLSRFGQDNPNKIFVPTDEPHGYIEARVSRE
jgi:urate oxidase